MLLRRRSKKLW